MSTETEGKSMRVPERVIPIPNSISAQAQAFLALDHAPMPQAPPVHDKAAWRSFIQQIDSAWAAQLGAAVAGLEIVVETRTIAGVNVFVAEPRSIPDRNRDNAVVFFHGGALVSMGGECARHFTALEAAANHCRVFGVDFRNPPDHPYPAALDDCIAVYRELLKTYSPSQLAFTGASGGGNLAAAVPLKARDLGLPLPLAVGLFSPELDLTESGDTFQTNRYVDVALPEGIPLHIALYANGHDLRDPYLSPLFGDFNKGFPPTFIQSGTRDLFLSNSVRMHRALRRARVDVELHIGEAMPHCGFGGAPEDIELRHEFLRFLSRNGDWYSP